MNFSVRGNLHKLLDVDESDHVITTKKELKLKWTLDSNLGPLPSNSAAECKELLDATITQQ